MRTKFSMFTQGGAYALAKFYKEKLGCAIVSQPTYNPDTTMWDFECVVKFRS